MFSYILLNKHNKCSYKFFIFYQVKPSILHVWISLLSFCYTCHYMFRDDDFALLFPSLRRSEYCVRRCACVYVCVYMENYWIFLVNFMIRYPLQDYHWWWRSFLTSGFTAVYLLIYCIHFFITKLEIEGATSTFLYFGYTLIMVYLFFLLTGKCCVCFKYCYY